MAFWNFWSKNRGPAAPPPGEDLSQGPFAADMGTGAEFARRRLTELLDFYDGRARDYQRRSKGWTTWALRFAAAAGAIFTLSSLGVIDNVGAAVHASGLAAALPDWVGTAGPFRRDTDLGVILLGAAAFMAFFTQNRGHLRAFARYRLTHAAVLRIRTLFVMDVSALIDKGKRAPEDADAFSQTARKALVDALDVVDAERKQWAADMVNDYDALLRAAAPTIDPNRPST